METLIIREIDKIETLIQEQKTKINASVKKALYFAVKNSKTQEELERCAKVIELELDDKNWAEEIRFNK